MTWRDTFRTATEAVRTHRLRSALTMLGILIGITAVVLTVGLGQGAQAQVQDQINELGTNLLVISPGQHRRARPGARGGFGSASTLTTQDADALAVEDGGPGHPGRRGRRPPRRCRWSNGVDQLDHDAHRDDAELEGGALARRDRRPVHHREGRGRRRRGRRARARHRERAVQRPRPGRRDGHATTATKLEVIGVLEGAELVGRHVEQRPRDRAAEHLLSSGSSAGPTATR